MNQSVTYSINQLRFKRWSRKAYAVFQSLGISVSIGQLAVHVQEKSAVKFTPSKQKSLTNTSIEEIEDFSELEEILQTSLLIENQIIIAQKEIAAAGSAACATLYDKLNRYCTGSAFFMSNLKCLEVLSLNVK